MLKIILMIYIYCTYHIMIFYDNNKKYKIFYQLYYIYYIITFWKYVHSTRTILYKSYIYIFIFYKENISILLVLYIVLVLIMNKSFIIIDFKSIGYPKRICTTYKVPKLDNFSYVCTGTMYNPSICSLYFYIFNVYLFFDLFEFFVRCTSTKIHKNILFISFIFFNKGKRLYIVLVQFSLLSIF